MNRADLRNPRRVLVGAFYAALALSLAACGSVGTGTGSSAANTTLGGGSANLEWSPVTTTTSGAALEDLAGYKVYYGMSRDNLANLVVLADPGATSYLVSGLSAGTWYFGIVAYTNNGDESPLSDVVSKTLD